MASKMSAADLLEGQLTLYSVWDQEKLARKDGNLPPELMDLKPSEDTTEALSKRVDARFERAKAALREFTSCLSLLPLLAVMQFVPHVEEINTALAREAVGFAEQKAKIVALRKAERDA